MSPLFKFLPVAVCLMSGCASQIEESESTSEAAYSRHTFVLSCGSTNFPYLSISRPSSVVGLQSGVSGRVNLDWSDHVTPGFAYDLTITSPRAGTVRFEGSNADKSTSSVVEAKGFFLDSNSASSRDVLVSSVAVRTGSVSRVFSNCRANQELLAFVR